MNWDCFDGRRRARADRLAGTLAALVLLPLAVPGVTARAGDAGSKSRTQPAAAIPAPSFPGNSKLPGVTIAAARLQALRLKADRFVTSVIVEPYRDSLYRWTRPVCPLVAGLPKAQGEFVLQRISKAAAEAHAPLAGRVCQPNLFVVATGSPDLLLRKWWERDRQMYNFKYLGIETVEEFVDSKRPIRAWYNTYQGCGAGSAATSTLTEMLVGGLGVPPGYGPPACSGTIRTRIVRMATGSNISSVIVVVDGRRMNNITIGQMADYIAMVGLSDVRPDVDRTAVPSILELFGHGKPPQGLTRWDRALLYALYNTGHRSRLGVPQLEIAMIRRVAP